MLPPDAAERAAALERGGARALSEPREGSQPWTIAISEPDANAWLTHRMKRWAENREIDAASLTTADGKDIPPPRVHFDRGRIRLGVEINGRVIGFSTVPAVESDALFCREPRFFMGRLELSAAQSAALASTLTARLGPGITNENREFVEALLEGSTPLFQPATFPLDDGRTISVLRIVVEDDRLLFTCQTSKAGKTSP